MLRSLSEGDPVVSWRGYDLDAPQDRGAVMKVTITQIVTTGGVRWNKSSGCMIGDRGFRIARLYLANDQRIKDALVRSGERRAREALVGDLVLAATSWAEGPSQEAATRLRKAIDGVGPFLGQ